MKNFRIHKNRIRNKKAFTLAEMLVAMLIMSFAGLLVIGGLAVISKSFQDLLLHSQTQMVLKEYMGEIRSGFLSADLDSELIINDEEAEDNSRPAFTHSGFDCVGYYTVLNNAGTEVPDGDTDDALGTIVFQPVSFDYGSNLAVKDSYEAEKQDYISLISTRLSNDFTAKIEYIFNDSTQMFVGKVTVKSARVLSSGEHVVLSGVFNVSPLCREIDTVEAG